MQYYQQLLGCSTGSPTGSINALAAAKIITQDKSTKPIRDAYFTCLEDTIKTCKAAAEVLRPVAKGSSAAAGAAAGGSSTATAAREGGSPQRGRHGMSAAAAAAVLGPDTLFDDVETAAAAAAGVDAGLGKLLPGGGAAAGLGPGSLSDDVRLLLMSSNLSFMRERLVGGLTQRFLLVLTGEQQQVGCCVADLLGLLVLPLMDEAYCRASRVCNSLCLQTQLLLLPNRHLLLVLLVWLYPGASTLAGFWEPTAHMPHVLPVGFPRLGFF